MTEDKSSTPNFNALSASSVEADADKLPFYPLLRVQELGEIRDLRDELPSEVRKYLQPHEKVVHIHYPEVSLPERPLSALEVVMKAAHASSPEEIGLYGPTVASVNPLEDSEARSRYEAQHGRDDLQAAMDVEPTHPSLLDATLVTLAESQGVEDEPNIEGVPFRQEKVGSIILLNLNPDDALAKKFTKIGGWGYPRYTSADAPGSFINAMALRQSQDPSYLFRHSYNARDGAVYPLSKAFERSTQWLLDRTAENPQGFVEYKKYKYGGMRNQGWRDSANALVHADGSWANSEYGIAAIDVQGISYDGLRNAARIYREFYQDEQKAAELDDRAWNLQKQVIEKGWIQDARGGYFVSGWDRDENGGLRQLQVRTSAMGRLLRSNILKSDNPQVQEMVYELVRTLLSPEMLTRWGIRTLSSEEVGYTPFGYHIGTTWDHDTNEIAAGMSDFGFYGLDRLVGATATNLNERTGLFLEHTSGYDSEEPHIPNRDTYVYNELYDELYMYEQVPPIAQTWAASTELAKQYRYKHIPLSATDSNKRAFEARIMAGLHFQLNPQFDR